MAAAKRSSGSGTVVALVVFIVLTFVGAGAAVYLFQRYAQVSRALEVNQAAFAKEVVDVFEAEGWPLSRQSTTEFGIQYETEAYRDVAARLDDAKTYEEMKDPLGWKTKQEVQGALQWSAGTGGTEYDTVESLLYFLEETHADLTQQVKELQTDKDDLVQARDNIEKQLQTEIQSLQDENTRDGQNRLDEADRIRAEVNSMKAVYEAARADVLRWQGKYDGALKEADARQAELRKEGDGWKQLYMEALSGTKPSETMEAQGSVLEVDSYEEIVVLEGGKDIGREANTRFVVYSESPTGVRSARGEVIISKVNLTTSTAIITTQEHYIRRRDRFVSTGVWEAFHAPSVEPVEEVLGEGYIPEEATPAETEETGPAFGEEETEAGGGEEEAETPAYETEPDDDVLFW